MTGAGQQDTITLRLPPSRAFADLSRVGLAALLRIHRIDPGDIGDLATSVHEIAREMTGGGSEVVVEFRITDTEIVVDLTGDGRPELYFHTNGRFGWAGPAEGLPEQPWPFHALSEDLGLSHFRIQGRLFVFPQVQTT